MTVPSSDAEVFDAPQPKPVEQLVAESNGSANNAPIIQMTSADLPPELHTTASQPAPSLDPVPSAPPPAPTPPAPPIETEPNVPDALPDDQPDEPGSDLAVQSNVQVEVWSNDEAWDHETIEFMGDKINARKPTDQALGGFSLASSKYIKASTRNDISGLFIARHLSPQSYDRVFSRLMDPDDTEYTAQTIGELMSAIVALRGD